jgi:hypothetical protein
MFAVRLHPQGLLQIRGLAAVYPSLTKTHTPTYQIFDRSAKQLQRDCAAGRNAGAKSRVVDYLRDEVADRLMERLLVCSIELLYTDFTVCAEVMLGH